MSTDPFVVRLTGWQKGLRTIDLMKLMRRSGKVNLPRAKELVEKLLHGNAIAIGFEAAHEAQEFLRDAESMGALGTVEAGPV